MSSVKPLTRSLLQTTAFVVATIAASTASSAPTKIRVISWNDLGMHCMDPGYQVFALLPPFNTFNTQVVLDGKLVRGPGVITLTYEATPDPTGSINTSSAGKTDFWTYLPSLFGVSLPVDTGLAGFAMPGPTNTPKAVPFVPGLNWFHAEGIPITPYDDTGAKNPYPMLKTVARDPVSGAVWGSTVNVAPVSDEMDCARCHASGGSPFAMPESGWLFDGNVVDDWRLNILRLHDERNAGNPQYASALTQKGFSPAGLLATVQSTGKAILCAACHASNALPGTGIAGISMLTSALHGLHADVLDSSGLTLDDSTNRASCYTCHPGSETRCLRGAMGKAVGQDGLLSMQCQSCHGDMTAVADPNRTPWLEEPACQECHTGTATQNSGAIRFTSVFDQNGNPHVPANATFATNSNVPAAGFDLYRFSAGHGGLQCSACHGSPHAEYPALHPNDNIQSQQMQGHIGVVSECTACHVTMPSTVTGGPHGMHTIGQNWVGQHGDAAENGGTAQCRTCHGTDSKGTVLSFAQADRTLSTKYGTKTFWRGFRIGCYDCHNGPNSDDAINNTPPAVTNKSVSTPADQPLVIALTGTDANGHALTYRIVEQPEHGSVAQNGASATYFPEVGFVGPTTFKFAARDPFTDSNLGTVTVQVTAPSCKGFAKPHGFGCPGSGGFLPQLTWTGCPTSNGAITLTLSKATPNASALLLFGTTSATTMLAEGCVLRVGGLLPLTLSLPTGGVAPGSGGFAIPATLPPGLPPATLWMQAFVPDAGAPAGFEATPALELHIE
ncbi:MAG: hypothetical protein IPH13_02625 [Planctomycetes bacterium]|nr:hypothetical protein [Planctomycetota bacterium]MCC7170041.1 hypothetical protein [Planctomycetota bacterium]